MNKFFLGCVCMCCARASFYFIVTRLEVLYFPFISDLLFIVYVFISFSSFILEFANFALLKLSKSIAILSAAQLNTCLTVTLCKSFLGAFCVRLFWRTFTFK